MLFICTLHAAVSAGPAQLKPFFRPVSAIDIGAELLSSHIGAERETIYTKLTPQQSSGHEPEATPPTQRQHHPLRGSTTHFSRLQAAVIEANQEQPEGCTHVGHS